jgi:uncharacterized membrane protein
MQETSHAETLALERLLFFSDAVFAIAITLLVIEIKLPPLPHTPGEAELGRALVSLAPLFTGFVISFLLIAQTWVEHHKMGRQLRAYDVGLLWRNAFLLLFVAFLPFATAVMSEHPRLRVAVSLYAFTFGGLGLAKLGFWRHAVRRGLVERDSLEARSISRRVWATPLTAAGVGVAALAGVPHAYAGFALIPVVASGLDRPRPAAKPVLEREGA